MIASATFYKLKLQRCPFFFMVIYMIPSVIFILLSYTSFWINVNSVTARTSLAITTVLISVSYKNSVEDLTPPLNYYAWIQRYFIGILFFNVFAMFEYALVNYCNYNYQNQKNRIDETVKSIRVNLTKYKKKLFKRLR